MSVSWVFHTKLHAWCREYNIALRTEMKRREVASSDAKRSAELAAYFTHAKLQPYHTSLALRNAMTIFTKLKNFNTCATFCRRMLEVNATQKVCSSESDARHCHLSDNAKALA